MKNHIALAWKISPGTITGYNVYRENVELTHNQSDQTDALLTPTPITALTFEDDTVLPGKRYSYFVRSINDGVESNNSLSVVSHGVGKVSSATASAQGTRRLSDMSEFIKNDVSGMPQKPVAPLGLRITEEV
jgi:hypothetical protein